MDLPDIFTHIYFVTIIVIGIYMIRLFARLATAIEKIANSAENCCKSK